MKVTSRETGIEYNCKWSIDTSGWLDHAWVKVYLPRVSPLKHLFPWEKVGSYPSSILKEDAKDCGPSATRSAFHNAVRRYEYEVERDAKDAAKRALPRACPEAWTL